MRIFGEVHDAGGVGAVRQAGKVTDLMDGLDEHLPKGRISVAGDMRVPEQGAQGDDAATAPDRGETAAGPHSGGNEVAIEQGQTPTAVLRRRRDEVLQHGGCIEGRAGRGFPVGWGSEGSFHDERRVEAPR